MWTEITSNVRIPSNITINTRILEGHKQTPARPLKYVNGQWITETGEIVEESLKPTHYWKALLKG